MQYFANLHYNLCKLPADFVEYRRRLLIYRVYVPWLIAQFDFRRTGRGRPPQLRTFGKCNRFFQAPERDSLEMPREKAGTRLSVSIRY